MKKWTALLGIVAACNGSAVDLGGGQSDSLVVDASTAVDTGTPATCGYSVHSAACTYSGSCSDGSGYLAVYAPYCISGPHGPATSFMSVTQVTAALAGIWTECEDDPNTTLDSPVRSIDRNSPGIEFTSDGRFQLFAYAPTTFGVAEDETIVPGSDPADMGTYDVVEVDDAAGSPSVPEYEVRLVASDGSVHPWVLQAWGPPVQLTFGRPVPPFELFAYTHPPKRNYETNVCGAPFGPIDTPTSGADALARMQGRWIRCPTAFPATDPFGAQGFEIEGDGTWYPLVADETGTLVRELGPGTLPEAGISFAQGSVEVVGSSPPSLRFNTGDSLSGQYTVLQPILGACGTLAFAASDGNPQSYEYVRAP
jgi:hypothetical protein